MIQFPFSAFLLSFHSSSSFLPFFFFSILILLFASHHFVHHSLPLFPPSSYIFLPFFLPVCFSSFLPTFLPSFLSVSFPYLHFNLSSPLFYTIIHCLFPSPRYFHSYFLPSLLLFFSPFSFSFLLNRIYLPIILIFPSFTSIIPLPNLLEMILYRIIFFFLFLYGLIHEISVYPVLSHFIYSSFINSYIDHSLIFIFNVYYLLSPFHSFQSLFESIKIFFFFFAPVYHIRKISCHNKYDELFLSM